jgi:hypothetical protein
MVLSRSFLHELAVQVRKNSVDDTQAVKELEVKKF